ncbi:MAG: apolipoprotein N-acyltransferase [Sandaracinaceae bacterium]|nr:apolipoprotein N-acyltransferase [Sandaracinaceae bacterium]
MTRKKKRRRSPPAAAAPAPAPEPPKPPRDWAEIGRAYGLLLLSAILMFLGFAGFGVWPLAFVGMVPALWVMDQSQAKGWVFFRRALFFGYVAWYGGFYWVVDTIVDFGGFPYALAAFFASVYFLYQALQYVLMLWLYRRARERGFEATLSLVVAFVASEMVFPQLFDNFYGNSFHAVPQLVQVADLGGPLLLSALAMLGNGAAYVVVRAVVVREERWPKVAPAVFLGVLAFTLGYGVYRIGEVEARMAAAPALQLGVVQTNMGIYEKRDDPGEGLRRHLEQSLELEAEGPLDLLVWPESAATFRLPRDPGVPIEGYFHRAIAFYGLEDPGFPRTPLLFGGLSSELGEGENRLYNTAFLTDDQGRIAAHYDKTYLLAFGEYLPLGETFPILYEWSPNTGHFTPGDQVHSLPFGDHRIGALVCYEDILPGFVRSIMNEDDPNLLVNVTNDAWFGDTQEPWVHLALAEMRAVEHHRYLVRATNTGVSAIIDPLGRVSAHSETFERASLRGEVRMMEGSTPYRILGNWPGWLALIAMGYIGFLGRRPPPRAPSTPEPAPPAPARKGPRDDEEE